MCIGHEVSSRRPHTSHLYTLKHTHRYTPRAFKNVQNDCMYVKYFLSCNVQLSGIKSIKRIPSNSLYIIIRSSKKVLNLSTEGRTKGTEKCRVLSRPIHSVRAHVYFQQIKTNRGLDSNVSNNNIMIYLLLHNKTDGT